MNVMQSIVRTRWAAALVGCLSSGSGLLFAVVGRRHGWLLANHAPWVALLISIATAAALTAWLIPFTNDRELLFQIALDYRVDGDKAAALRAYRSFLRHAPKSRHRAAVERQIALLQAHADDAGDIASDERLCAG